jgi:Rps23 Pro-64 3,4-dihydroxylase Tpa1-like proline 4-hydroxylase
MSEARDIRLEVRLASGEAHRLRLREDSPTLLALFGALASPDAGLDMIELPLDEGRVACSFRASQVISIVSEPPVLLNRAGPLAATDARGAASGVAIHRPRYVVIDDFLCPDEHRELVEFSIASEHRFQAGTVTDANAEYRQNLNVPHFGETAHAKLFENRLLIWLPLIVADLGLEMFPLSSIETQLTAAGTGHFFKRHADAASGNTRFLTCIFYLAREPRGFSGGELRLYDRSPRGDGAWDVADTFRTIAPVSNRLVVFPSDEMHEARPVRCPSNAFSSYRFAITTWLHRSETADAGQTFGWGHFRCAALAPQFG